MEKNESKSIIKTAFLGKRYYQITDINEKVRYMVMNGIFMIALIPLIIMGIRAIQHDTVRGAINFIIAGSALCSLIMMRTKIPLKVVPPIPVTLFGGFCLYLLYSGGYGMWLAVWIFSFPLIAIFLCKMTVGLIYSVIGLIIAAVFLYNPAIPVYSLVDPAVKYRFIAAYIFITGLTVIFEYVNILKDRKEKQMIKDLADEKERTEKANEENRRREIEEYNRQKEAERISQEKIQAILDASPMICAIFDKDSNCLQVNKEAERMFNTTTYEYMNNFDQFLPKLQPDGTPSMQKSIECIGRALKDGYARYEFMYQLKDGTPVPVEEVGQRIKIDGQDHVICYTRDLREYHKLKEEEQRLAQEHIQAMADQLYECVQRQAAAVSQSSASIEEMIANIRSVTETLTRNIEKVKELEIASDVGRSGLGGVATNIQEIGRESESLLEINSVMENIASQTNLLSMNAAIEAAHAGEAGRGFAVVADEIRKLAESSGNQSKTISAVLKKIKDSIDTITKSTGNVLSKFEEMDGGIKIVAEQDNNILKAMEEQNQGSQEVMAAISEVNSITHQVEDASRKLQEGRKSA